MRDQLAQFFPATPATIRHVPIEGVLLTDAELDHTLGLARQEMIDRAAQKLERLIRKRLKKS